MAFHFMHDLFNTFIKCSHIKEKAKAHDFIPSDLNTKVVEKEKKIWMSCFDQILKYAKSFFFRL